VAIDLQGVGLKPSYVHGEIDTTVTLAARRFSAATAKELSG